VFISNAYAQAGGGAGGFDVMTFLPMIAIFVLFYFMLIRPQQKRAKETKAMLEALQKGDEVVAGGGIIGRISKLDESYVTLEIADNVEIHVQRPAVQMLLPKGTMKNL
jgi:preprotein translocase subunit YajC